MYSNCSNISYTFLFLFLNNLLVIRARNHKMLDRMANREDPDQTASEQSDLVLPCLSRPFKKAEGS